MKKHRTFVENQDYIVRYLPFPNCSVDGAIMKGEDGIDYIYINTNVCLKRQIIALKHELEHLSNDDLYSEEPTYIIEGRMND